MMRRELPSSCRNSPTRRRSVPSNKVDHGCAHFLKRIIAKQNLAVHFHATSLVSIRNRNACCASASCDRVLCGRVDQTIFAASAARISDAAFCNCRRQRGAMRRAPNDRRRLRSTPSAARSATSASNTCADLRERDNRAIAQDRGPRCLRMRLRARHQLPTTARCKRRPPPRGIGRELTAQNNFFFRRERVAALARFLRR